MSAKHQKAHRAMRSAAFLLAVIGVSTLGGGDVTKEAEDPKVADWNSLPPLTPATIMETSQLTIQTLAPQSNQPQNQQQNDLQTMQQNLEQALYNFLGTQGSFSPFPAQQLNTPLDDPWGGP